VRAAQKNGARTFKTICLHQLIAQVMSPYQSAKKMVEKETPKCDILEGVVHEYPICLTALRRCTVWAFKL
jgi:hypothetical protein